MRGAPQCLQWGSEPSSWLPHAPCSWHPSPSASEPPSRPSLLPEGAPQLLHSAQRNMAGNIQTCSWCCKQLLGWQLLHSAQHSATGSIQTGSCCCNNMCGWQLCKGHDWSLMTMPVGSIAMVHVSAVEHATLWHAGGHQ